LTGGIPGTNLRDSVNRRGVREPKNSWEQVSGMKKGKAIMGKTHAP
jgi:hypothetical protein